MAAQDYVAVVEQLYVSYFGRPADYFGLQNFTAQLDALKAPTDFVALNAAVQANKTGPLASLVNSFNSSAESAALYGTDNSQVGISKFVEAIYLNILNRAPDVSGWAFWTGEIVAGRLTRANAAMAITEGALKNTTAQGLLDAKSVQNKLAVATNFTAGLDTVTEINAFSGDAAAASGRGLIKGVDSTTDVAAYQSTVDSTIASIVTGSIPSTNTNLTANVDTLTGANGNDTFNGVIGSGVATNNTLNALDTIDGGAGNDTLNILDVAAAGGTALPGGIIVKNVETIAFRSAGAVSFDQSTATGVTGVTKLVVGQATTATLTAAATTAVEVKAATGDVTVDGGSNVTVATAGGAGVDVAIGATTVAKGAVSVTNSNQADGNIAIDGGTSVSVTAAGATTGAVTVGQGGAATDLPTGAIAVSVTGAAADGAAPAVRGNITVSGGTKVSVIQSATSDASAAAEDAAATTNTITQGDISVTGGKNTTEVSVQQTAASAGSDATPETVGAKTVDVVTFIKLAANESVTVGGLTFTAAKALTAAQVAAAFAGLTTGSTQGTAPASNGVYSGTFSTKFTSGAVVADGTNQTVTFTTAKADGTATIAVADTSADALLSLSVNETTAGINHVDAEAGELAVVAGKVTIADSGDKKITTVSIDGFGAGSTVASNALTTLTLAHSAADLTVTNATAGALALNINGLGDADTTTAAAIDLGNAYTSVNITTSGADSLAAVTADGATAVTVAGTNVADLTGSSFAALKSLTVKGSAGVVADVSAVATVTSVDTTGTTGASTVTIDTATAAFAGGAGADTVNLATTNTTKAVTLGAGNDTLSLFAGTTSLTATMSGGDGTDTLVMDAADAATASAGVAFGGKIDGFEKLSLRAAAADQTIDLANLDNISYVISAGAAATFTETLKNLAANSTVELTTAAAGTVAATLADATGTSDVLNVVLKNAAATDFGILKAAGVETINITATDTKASTIDTFTLNLNAAAAKSVVVTGNANVTLNGASADVALTSLDGSAMTGKLVASTNGTVAETIKGGSAADTLTAVGNGDTLIGGAGNDKLIVTGNLATLTGGAGNDTFDVSDATSNVNSYATITDLTAGDIIKFADTAATESFKASKVVLADTAVFQDYANAAIAQTAQGEISWFQIGGNTYVIEHAQVGGTSFLNGTDVIVKITGAVDLSHSSFNAGAGQQTLVYIV